MFYDSFFIMLFRCWTLFFFFSSRRRHTSCALVTGVQTCALPICALIGRELSFAVREIVANAVRHAGATMVNFALEPDGNRIALQVSDDGVPNMARLGRSEASSVGKERGST